jgi:hypothetical protein
VFCVINVNYLVLNGLEIDLITMRVIIVIIIIILFFNLVTFQTIAIITFLFVLRIEYPILHMYHIFIMSSSAYQPINDQPYLMTKTVHRL